MLKNWSVTPPHKFTMSAYNALSFQVFDPASKERQGLGGVVAPALEWDFRPQQDLVATRVRKDKDTADAVQNS